MVVIAVVFVCADLVQRTLIIAIIKVRPLARDRILSRWKVLLTNVAFWVMSRIGGVRFDISARIPFGPGVLVIMNHQSLLDIPIALKVVVGGYPLIVARDRYRKNIPLVSHAIRLYGHPTVRPGEGGTEQVEMLRDLAETTSRPLVIYPEGSRSRDGEIHPFRTAGLKAILATRSWKVYIIVVDGLWRSVSLGGFIKNASALETRVESEGPFDFDPATGDTDRFAEDIEHRMRDKLHAMRSSRADLVAH